MTLLIADDSSPLAPTGNLPPKIRESQATVMQSIAKGSVAGAMEVLIDHPLWSIKTRLQRGDIFTLNPYLLYRGILPNAASMVPVTAIQVGLNRCFQRYGFSGVTEYSDSQRMTAAFVAGLGSSLVSCPTEMVMTHQSRVGGRFYVSRRHLTASFGWRCLWTGLPATAMREGVFSAFFLAVTPILKVKFHPYGISDPVASLGAGMVAGASAALVSQAFDTVKTMQQVTRLGPAEAARHIYQARGLYGFFRGGLPRGLNVMSAVTILGYVNEKLDLAIGEEVESSGSHSVKARQ